MNRRDLMTLTGGAAAWPVAARAQQGERVRRISFLTQYAEGDPMGQARVVAFQQGLEKLGWTIGRNVRIDYRWGAADAEKVRAATAGLMALAPDVILASTSQAVATLQRATRTVPIVFTSVIEPAAQGFIGSLAHPGGNITGFTNMETTVGAKWLELLKELAPHVARVAFMFSPDNPGPAQYAGSVTAAAPKLAVEVVMAPVRGPAEIEAAVALVGREPGGGLILPPDGFTIVYRNDLANRNSLPAIYGIRNFADDAAYVDRILRGEKPGDLPVQQPTKFEFVINLKTAKALGLEVPLLLQQRADEVLE